MITKSIGKNTLGGGSKMNVDLKTYNRSTHDLSHVWRNTQSVGTLVPFLVEPALPGDTHEINLNADVMTHPTVGPLFGSFKLQLDVFSCPIRLYNAMLHNNALGIGMDMSKVKFPIIGINNTLGKSMRFNPSHLLSYLGKRGARKGETQTNGLTFLMYWDIYKNYYANKQEKNAYYIGKGVKLAQATGNDGSVKNGEIKTTWMGAMTIVQYNNFQLLAAVPSYIKISIDSDTLVDVEKYFYSYKATISNRNTVSGTTQIERKTLPTREIFTYNSVKKQFEYSAGETYQGWNLLELISTEETPRIGLIPFELSEIDLAREKILKAGNSQAFQIDGIPGALYSNVSINDMDGYIEEPQYLLGLKTYQSDIFNNWIQTEWVDGDNGINAITAIDTSGGSFNLDTLNLAKKVYDMLNRIAISGGTYQDWIETVYTNDYIERSETPIYEGGMSQEIVFQEVISQSATAEEPLGTLAGRGKLGGERKGGTIKIKTTEPSFIIGIASITPRIDYSQGNGYWTEWKNMNDLHKPALDGIGFQDLVEWKAAYWGTGAIGKQPAWLDYMTAVNRVYGNFAAGESEAFMILDRNYKKDDAGEHIADFTTYIDPQKWNGIFADQSLDAMNFWVQIGIGMTARRVMSAKMIPNL